MKKWILALTLLSALSANGNENVEKIAYCSSISHHGVDLDIFANKVTNEITIRATGGDGYPKDYNVDSAEHLIQSRPVLKGVEDDYLILGIFALNRGQDLKSMKLKYSATAADGSKLALTINDGINLNINGFDQATWCKNMM